MCILGGKIWQPAHPDVGLCLYCGLVETYLEQEATLEGMVEVIGKVSSGYEYSIKRFHLLKYDVLYSVLCLCNTSATHVLALGEHSIRLIE